MSKYLIDFQETGVSTLNVDLVCKDWNDKFSISTWINDKDETYTLNVTKRKKSFLKTQISKETANEIISKLGLISLKSPFFNSGGSYHSETFIKSEIKRLEIMEKEKEEELSAVKNTLYKYKISIK